MEKLSYKIDVFEWSYGPPSAPHFKAKLNINDIPIVELVNQYVVTYVRCRSRILMLLVMFLEMAARLNLYKNSFITA